MLSARQAMSRLLKSMLTPIVIIACCCSVGVLYNIFYCNRNGCGRPTNGAVVTCICVYTRLAIECSAQCYNRKWYERPQTQRAKNVERVKVRQLDREDSNNNNYKITTEKHLAFP